MKFVFAFLMVLTPWYFIFPQEIVKNGGFENFSCDHGVETNNTPISNWNTLGNFGKHVKLVGNIITPCSAIVPYKPKEGKHFLSLGFNVNSMRVEPQFIQTELSQRLEKNEVYDISFYLLIADNSIGFLNEFQLLFNGEPLSLNHNLLDAQFSAGLVKVGLSDFPKGNWVKVNAQYKALGIETTLAIGSLNQRFSFGRGWNNYMAERSDPNAPDVLVYIDDLNIVKQNKKGLNETTHELIQNGGFENEIPLQSSLLNRNKQLNILTQGWINLSEKNVFAHSEESLHQFRNKNYQPKTGFGMLVFDALVTNKYHNYQKVWSEEKADGYYIIRRYENEISPLPDLYYHKGAVANLLNQTLDKDKVYNLSLKVRITESSAFGVPEIGIYFLEEMPNVSDFDISNFEPSLTFSISTEDQNIGTDWQHIQARYSAKGNENYMLLAYHDPFNIGVVKNHFFQPQQFSTCGPHGAYDCINKIITYKDSLFARYIVDDVSLSKMGFQSQKEIKHFTLAIDLGGVKSNNELLEEVLCKIPKTLNTYPLNASLDIVNIKRRYRRTQLGTLPNTNRLLRVFNRAEISRKAGRTELPDWFLKHDEMNRFKMEEEKFILISDGHINLDEISNQIDKGATTNFYILLLGERNNFQAIEYKLKNYQNIKLFYFYEDLSRFFESIWK